VDLSQKGHRDVLMLIAGLNAEESLVSKTQSGRGDTSQNGWVPGPSCRCSPLSRVVRRRVLCRKWCNFRNVRMNKRPFVLDNDNIDELPRSGVLEFDYVGTTRPPPDAKPSSADRLRVIMAPLGVRTPE
jgi:hypothetical protein